METMMDDEAAAPGLGYSRPITAPGRGDQGGETIETVKEIRLIRLDV